MLGGGRSVFRGSAPPHCPHVHIVHTAHAEADLVQLKYDALPFEISPVYISFTLLALINITAVCEFADSFPEVINHSLLLTLKPNSLLLPPSFPHPLLKSNLCREDVNHM